MTTSPTSRRTARWRSARPLQALKHFKMPVSVNFLSLSDVGSEGDMLIIVLDSLDSFMASNALARELPSIVFECHLAVVL